LIPSQHKKIDNDFASNVFLTRASLLDQYHITSDLFDVGAVFCRTNYRDNYQQLTKKNPFKIALLTMSLMVFIQPR